MKKERFFGKPDQVEIDFIIRNGKTIVVELRSLASKADLSIFGEGLNFTRR